MTASDLTVQRRSISSTMHKVAQAAIIVAGATAIVKLVAFYKEMLVAKTFGLSHEMDAFVIAYGVVSFLIGILSSAIQASLIPWLCGLDDQDVSVRKNTVAQAFTILVLVGTVFTLLLSLAADPLVMVVGYALPEQPHLLAVSLVRIFSLQLFFVVINIFFYSTLQKGKRFFMAGVAPLLTPLAVVMSIMLFSEDYGIYTLAFGALAGAITETLILWLLLARRGTCPGLIRPHFSDELRRLMSQSWIMMVGAALMGSTVLVDRAMASTLGTGSVSALAYASRVPSLIDSLGATAIATAVLPYFSDMVNRRDWGACRHHLKIYAWVLFAVSLPVMFALVWFSDDIVRLIFQRGEFTARDTTLVADVQQMYLLAIPPFIVGLLAVRMLSALSINHVITYIAIVNVGLNIVLNLLFMRYFGTTGIALSTAFVYSISSALTFYFALCAVNRNILYQQENVSIQRDNT